MQVDLVQITPNAEAFCAKLARVSSSNPDNPEYKSLLAYCMKHGHWSVFESAHMTLSIETSRAIAAQVLRHKSFNFQETSQRYKDVSALGFEQITPRRQDVKNRQNSIDDLPEATIVYFENAMRGVQDLALRHYQDFLKMGIAKESARFILPLSVTTNLYMTGNLRSWIHYIQVRNTLDTQLEHRQIAERALDILLEQCPTIGELLYESDK